jgi:hypothetical protein
MRCAKSFSGAVVDDPATGGAPAGVSIRLTPVYGITIPVIVRKGRLDVAATLANPHVVRDEQGTYLEIDMTRSGQRSTYGELIGTTVKGDRIFTLKGVAIYAEVTRRVVRVPLNPEQAGQMRGAVRIEYRELPENGGQKIAELVSNIR